MEKPSELDSLFRMLEIREANGFSIPSDINQLKITVRKSALYRRLMEGKEPFPEPPPRAYSYPWYELMENGVAYPGEVWKPTSWDKCFTNYPSIVIDQSPWKVLEELGEDEWIVTYEYGRDDKRQFASGKWHVMCVGCRFPRVQESSWAYFWKIEKVE